MQHKRKFLHSQFSYSSRKCLNSYFFFFSFTNNNNNNIRTVSILRPIKVATVLLLWFAQSIRIGFSRAINLHGSHTHRCSWQNSLTFLYWAYILHTRVCVCVKWEKCVHFLSFVCKMMPIFHSSTTVLLILKL